MKGITPKKPEDKQSNTNESICSVKGADSDIGKLECNQGEVLKGINADKTPICAPVVAGAQTGSVVSGANVETEAKNAVESTTCSPGSGDLTTHTAETSQETDLHIISVFKPFTPGKPIEVIVKKRTKPVIIVLFSPLQNASNQPYGSSEKVRQKWDIKEEEGGNISKVFVMNMDDVNGIIFSKRSEFSVMQFFSSWQYPSADALELINQAQLQTRVALKKFEGCNSLDRFVVN